MSHHDYSELVILFEDFLSKKVITREPASLYEPIKYMNSIGGKRIRPVLVLMAYNLWNDDVATALEPALAVEYFHNFTLMHDDIMDEAALRRGHESVHTRFGNNTAILSGDAMLIKCFEYLIDFELNYKLPISITQVMARIAIEICEGQQMDMDFEKRDDVSVEDYIEMIRKKTACLLGACLKLGACIAGDASEAGEKLYGFGENMGMAFQIQDDMLDTFGDQGMTGKQQGGDILRGKKNFPYVYAYSILNKDKREEFEQLYHEVSATNDVSRVVDTYIALGLQKHVDGVIIEYFRKAIECLDGVGKDGSALREFAEGMLGRRK